MGSVQQELRERMRTYLAEHRIAVAGTVGPGRAWAMPARYRPAGLELDVLLPRWADVAFHLEQDPQVLLVVLLSGGGEPLRWLEYQGTAHPVNKPDWTGLLPDGVSPARAHWLYALVRVSPTRIDLLDEGKGWGVRETLEC